MSKGLVSNLQSTYEGLLANLQDVPNTLRNKLQDTCQHMSELKSTFAHASSFGELESSVLNNGLNIMAEAENNMEDLLDFAFLNPVSIAEPQSAEPPLPMETTQSGFGLLSSICLSETQSAEPLLPTETTSSGFAFQSAVSLPDECLEFQVPVEIEHTSRRETEEREDRYDILKIQREYDRMTACYDDDD